MDVGKIRVKQDQEEQIGFEDALGQLEDIVHDLEEGQIGLTEAMKRYEQGVKLLRRCYGMLERAERKIELLTGTDDEDAAETDPFDDETSLELAQQEQPRSSRRKVTKKGKKKAKRKPPESPGTMDDPPSLF